MGCNLERALHKFAIAYRLIALIPKNHDKINLQSEANQSNVKHSDAIECQLT